MSSVWIFRRSAGSVRLLRPSFPGGSVERTPGTEKIPSHVPKPKLPKVEESPLTGIEERHATYSALLKGLTLASDHRQNLLCRGLSEEEILRLGYKTTPVLGFSSLAKRLREAGLYLEGVPGFYKKRGQWTIQFPGRGILIPVRDIAGRIQGLQIRLDNVEKRKFRWLSSAELEEGCGAKTWVHLAGSKASCNSDRGPLESRCDSLPHWADCTGSCWGKFSVPAKACPGRVESSGNGENRDCL